MAIQNRSTTLPEIWAKNAQTTIPTPPVAGITYRNQALNSTAIDKAWVYKEIVDSANFNQHAYLQDMLIKEAEQYGVMRWNNATTYKQGGFCLAQDGNLYQAKRDNVNKEPTANSADWGKNPELSAYQLKSNLVQSLSQATDKYPSAKAVQDITNSLQNAVNGKVGKTGDETFSGVKTCQSDEPRFGLKHTGIDVTTAPAEQKSTRIFFSDKNNKWISEIGVYKNTDDGVISQITANNDTAGVASLQIICKKDGSKYGTCPTPPDAADSSTKIATTAWVNSRITSVMNNNKLQVVSSLPSRPNADTFYFIPED